MLACLTLAAPFLALSAAFTVAEIARLRKRHAAQLRTL